MYGCLLMNGLVPTRLWFVSTQQDHKLHRLTPTCLSSSSSGCQRKGHPFSGGYHLSYKYEYWWVFISAHQNFKILLSPPVLLSFYFGCMRMALCVLDIIFRLACVSQMHLVNIILYVLIDGLVLNRYLSFSTQHNHKLQLLMLTLFFVFPFAMYGKAIHQAS